MNLWLIYRSNIIQKSYRHSHWPLAWIETRTPREMTIYEQLVSITHQIIDEAFSEKVITPGITTTTDVEWWMRDKVRALGLQTWFHPSVDVQRSNEGAQSHLYSLFQSAGTHGDFAWRFVAL